MIQFSRFANVIAAQGGRVVLSIPEKLSRLMQSLKGVSEIVVDGAPLPTFDVQAPLISLPGILKVDIKNPPQQVPYLSADAELADQWKSRMISNNKGPRVGLVWSGQPKLKVDKYRSVPPEALAILKNAPVGQWYALQEMTLCPLALAWDNMTDLGMALDDFATTAAIMANLDLIITVDTAAAHLAGALGKPVWTIMRYSPCWRWGLDRLDTPWYPTMKLFRPAKPMEWTDVIKQIAEELKKFQK